MVNTKAQHIVANRRITSYHDQASTDLYGVGCHTGVLQFFKRLLFSADDWPIRIGSTNDELLDAYIPIRANTISAAGFLGSQHHLSKAEGQHTASLFDS